MNMTKKITLHLNSLEITTSNIQQMQAFYNGVFHSDLQPISFGKSVIYYGHLGGITIILSPNRFNNGNHNGKHQLSFTVSNLRKTIDLVKSVGGTQLQEIDIDGNYWYCSVADPDGNRIEFTEHL